MEQLEHSQRESIKKMSTERLRSKLTDAGFDEKQLDTMPREQLLDAYAKLMLSSKDAPLIAAVSKAQTGGGYDIELERMRLEFEMKKFEVEETRRKEEREAEEARRREDRETAILREEREEARRKEEREWEETR